MKYLVLILGVVLLSVLSVFSQASPSVPATSSWESVLPKAESSELITASYDKFKDETTITGVRHLFDCEGKNVPFDHLDISTSYTISGRDIKAPTSL